MLSRPVLIALGAAAFAIFPATASPYHPVAVTPLPEMPEGDFDQLAADVPHNRLYVSAEAGAAMYVFDLRSGALVRRGGPVGSPHKVAIDIARQHLFVADGADGSVKILDPDLGLVARVEVGPKPDTGLLDPRRHIFYVSSRDPAPGATGSLVTTISTENFAILARYAVPATTLKGLILDEQSRRLFVSARDKDGIATISLDDGTVSISSPAGLHRNVPLAFDPASGHLFVGSRAPGMLNVVDTRTQTVTQTLPSTETSDSVSFDRGAGILYLSGDTGMSRYAVDKQGHASLLETDPSLSGKTSLYVPANHRIYVMRRKDKDAPAALQVFDVLK
ncbi:YncE family protein [Sphingomonas nostoxanthinifaciens]|uniref:YncE family protein n=1 Tax=Sphingomonas nostoxanthinifaciens TaxID=2872652 RepID=UPI001CC1E49F|nr:hypothetical protein [Sphingomonas nostoxanthinifaciens]UAK25919.1 hypothetical protein K8P63_07300 [Sphingomonas nostoxanthinifaciens]